MSDDNKNTKTDTLLNSAWDPANGAKRSNAEHLANRNKTYKELFGRSTDKLEADQRPSGQKPEQSTNACGDVINENTGFPLIDWGAHKVGR